MAAKTWDRVEPHTRSTDLEQGLQARIADPLWLLARQWQVGEFRGEDAASPIHARISARVNALETFRNDSRPNSSPEPIPARPLESMVECEAVLDGPAKLQLAGEAGLQFLRRLDSARLGSLRAKFRAKYPLQIPESELQGVPVHEAARLRLLGRRSIDGRALMHAVGTKQVNALGLGAQRAKLDPLLAQWAAEYRGRFVSPGPSGDTWADERLEYGFSLGVAAGQGEVVLAASEYPGGHLDWYGFEVDASEAASHGLGNASARTIVSDVLPVPLSYAGMPASRWWEFEEGDVYFGGIEAGPTDLARLIVAEFATMYSDDWFLLPLRLPVGTLSRIAHVDVLDTFGGQTRVYSTAATDHASLGGKPRAFAYFELAGDDSAAKNRTPWLLIPPALAGSLEGPPIESVSFVRDEAANLGWAIEQTIEGPTGKPLPRRLRTALAIGPGEPPTTDASTPKSTASDQPWGYRLQTEVPPHWIPLVPELINPQQGVNAQTRLRRARLQAWDALPDWAVGPQGQILAPTRALRLHEDEIPRGGVQVTRTWQLARASDGRLHLWVARRKRPGRGERGSGLQFDVIDR